MVTSNAAVSDKALGIGQASLCALGGTVLLDRDAASVVGADTDRQGVRWMGFGATTAARLVQNLGASG